MQNNASAPLPSKRMPPSHTAPTAPAFASANQHCQVPASEPRCTPTEKSASSTLALMVCVTPGNPCRPVWSRDSRTSSLLWNSTGFCWHLYCHHRFAPMTLPTPTPTAAISLLLDAARKRFPTYSHGPCVSTGMPQPSAPYTRKCCHR